MEDSIFGPKPSQHFNLDGRDLDLAYSDDNIPSNIEILDVENTKLRKKYLIN